MKIAIMIMILLVVSLLVYAWYRYESNNNALGLTQKVAANAKVGKVYNPTTIQPTKPVMGGGQTALVSKSGISLSRSSVDAARGAISVNASTGGGSVYSSPEDILNGCGQLITNLSKDNLNYPVFVAQLAEISQATAANVGTSTKPRIGIFLSPNAAYTTAAARKLWLDLNNIYLGTIKGALAQITLLSAQKLYYEQYAALLNTASGDYSHTDFAKNELALLNAVCTELTNETIQQVDAIIYGSFGAKNMDDYIARFGTIPGLALGWERVKWQASNDAYLAPVPYLYKTSNGHIFHTDSKGLYLDDGLNNNILTNFDGTKLYKCTTIQDQGKAIQNYMQQWQRKKAYTAAMAYQSNFTQAQPFINFVLGVCLAYVGVPPNAIKAATQITGLVGNGRL